MANEQNLIGHGFHELTASQQREIAQKGGLASVEAKRKKKTRRELALEIANAKVTNKKIKEMVKANTGIDDEDITGDAAVVNGVYMEALSGNMQAYDRWEQLTADQSSDNDKYELPARVIGESFVRINRQIKPNMTYVFEGGRGSTKSSFISLKIIELLKNNPNMHACIVRKVAGTLRDSVYAQMLWAINELGLNDEFDNTVSPLEITYKKTKQKIYFRGCDDPIKLKGIKTTFGYVGILWKEEKDQLAGEAEERNVNQSVLRGGDKSYDFSSYNPPKSKSNWVNKAKEVPNENRVIHHSTYETVDDEWLGQKFINDAEHLREINKEAYDHEYLGIPNGNGGNVFEYLEIRTITDEEISHMDKIWQGTDFGWYPDIYAFKRLYVDEARKKIYHIAEITGNKLSNAQTAQMIIDAGFDDYTITCDSAEPKSINDYRDKGLPARGAVKGPGSVEYGMKFLQGYTHVIDPARTPITYKEFTEYEYERDKEGNVISGYPDKDNHTIDATRYALESLYNKRGTSA
jgi:PBSX family phage terminase large subunit